MQPSLNLQGKHLDEISPNIWKLCPIGRMRASVNFVATRSILEKLAHDKSLEQAMNVASLPGIVDPVLTMPDIHQGYGFPIGGVAAFRLSDGVVSPGGVGYDINCGVRLLKTSTKKNELTPKVLKKLIEALARKIPAGVGSQRDDLPTGTKVLNQILAQGAAWAVKNGFGSPDDLDFIEERGRLNFCDPDAVGERARQRGLYQLGTLGSGNHFVEVQYIDEIYDKNAANTFGLSLDQVVVTIHTGSRGLGYQVCADSIEEALKACEKYKIALPEKELACAPIESPEGKKYLSAMAAAANFAFANRQVIAHWVRDVFSDEISDRNLPLLYDVCHNIAKFENGVCLHRKGATRAFPAGHPSLPRAYANVGQPVLVPGDMGRYSYILVGKESILERTYGSACHGAGRELSRAQAKKKSNYKSVLKGLTAQGIVVQAAGKNTLVEEMPEAYKDVAEVVRAIEGAKLVSSVARLRPLGVVKG